MNKQRGKAISYLASLAFSSPSYKHSVEICYIVFIHAENLLLGLFFLLRGSCFSAFTCIASFSLLSDQFWMCAAAAAALLLKFCGICCVYCLVWFLPRPFWPRQPVCVIVGRLSGLLTANRATLARLGVYETAGMCLVPPGRGR